MTRPVFMPEPLPAGLPGEPGDHVTLDGPEGRHALVHRLGRGEELDLVDGRGLRVTCTVDADPAPGAKALDLTVIAVTREPAQTPTLTLVQALAKGGRDEQAIETSTEIGVDAVIPWQANRSIVRWDRKKRVKAMDKWRNVLQAATKQARRAWTPDLVDPVDSGELAARIAEWTASGTRVLILHETATDRIAALAPEAATAPGIVVIVGPEGGIDDDELRAFEAAGARAVLLGPHVLRSASAGPAALTLLSAASGRW